MRTIADYSWRSAIQDAIACGDTARVQSLAATAGALLDLLEDIPASEWEQIYEKVSQRSGVKPTLTLVPGGCDD